MRLEDSQVYKGYAWQRTITRQQITVLTDKTSLEQTTHLANYARLQVPQIAAKHISSSAIANNLSTAEFLNLHCQTDLQLAGRLISDTEAQDLLLKCVQ